MFIRLLFLSVFICLSFGKSYLEVEPCENQRCQLPYCYCSNQSIPGELTVRNAPQFIAITINGPLENKIYGFLREFFLRKNFTNPDGRILFG